MLLEALAYALTAVRTPAPFRRHVSEAIGLWSRGRRQHRAWQPHLERTNSVIEQMMDRIPGRGTAVILGSGSLFDVPVEKLAARFRRVVLVDQAHLIGVQMRVRRLRNVSIEWRDLSAATTASPLNFLGRIPDLDWVVSVNLLSQLADAAPEGRERWVVDSHLSALAALPCPATLISDLEYRKEDRQGRVIERVDLLYGHRMPKPKARWAWEVAALGEESPKTARVHNVAVYPDWRRYAA